MNLDEKEIRRRKNQLVDLCHDLNGQIKHGNSLRCNVNRGNSEFQMKVEGDGSVGFTNNDGDTNLQIEGYGWSDHLRYDSEFKEFYLEDINVDMRLPTK